LGDVGEYPFGVPLEQHAEQLRLVVRSYESHAVGPGV
jgi:hypothetical protein